MKRKTLKESRAKSIKELKAAIRKIEIELVKSELNFGSDKAKGRRAVSQNRRGLAQLKTILSEKTLLEPSGKESGEGQ